jgi:hypothetical protein
MYGTGGSMRMGWLQSPPKTAPRGEVILNKRGFTETRNYHHRPHVFSSWCSCLRPCLTTTGFRCQQWMSHPGFLSQSASCDTSRNWPQAVPVEHRTHIEQDYVMDCMHGIPGPIPHPVTQASNEYWLRYCMSVTTRCSCTALQGTRVAAGTTSPLGLSTSPP